MSDDTPECMKKMEECVAEIREWKRKNMLKLNDDKTEVLVISIPFSLIGYMKLLSKGQSRVGAQDLSYTISITGKANKLSCRNLYFL